MTKILDLFQGRKARNDRFSRLVRPHLDLLYRMAYRWTQSRDDAEDLVQETLVKLVDHVGEMERVEKLSSWLIKVLYRNFVDLYRKRLRSPLDETHPWRADVSLIDELITRHRGEENAIKRLELQRDLLKALETLNAGQREVILLHDTEGYSAAEVSSILGISLGTVKSRLHRARLHLKNFLGPGTF